MIPCVATMWCHLKGMVCAVAVLPTLRRALSLDFVGHRPAPSPGLCARSGFVNHAMMRLLGMDNLDMVSFLNNGGQTFSHHPASKVCQFRALMAACARKDSTFRHRGRFLRLAPSATDLPAPFCFIVFRATEIGHLTYGPSGGLRTITSFFTDIEFETQPLLQSDDLSVAKTIGSVVARTPMELMEAVGAIGANKKAFDIAIVQSSTVSHLPTWTKFADSMSKELAAAMAQPPDKPRGGPDKPHETSAPLPGTTVVRPGFANKASAIIASAARTARSLHRPPTTHPSGPAAFALADMETGSPVHFSAAAHARNTLRPTDGRVLPPWAMDIRMPKRSPGALGAIDEAAAQCAAKRARRTFSPGDEGSKPDTEATPLADTTESASSCRLGLPPPPVAVAGRTRFSVVAGNQGGTMGPVLPSSVSGVKPSPSLQPGEVAVLRARDELERRYLPVFRQALPTSMGFRLRMPWVGRSFDILRDDVESSEVERDVGGWVQRVEAAMGSRVVELPSVPTGVEATQLAAPARASSAGRRQTGSAAASQVYTRCRSSPAGSVGTAASSRPVSQGTQTHWSSESRGAPLILADGPDAGFADISSGRSSVGSRDSFDEDLAMLGLA